jgi:propionate catabolism operon transcriptional regulator
MMTGSNKMKIKVLAIAPYTGLKDLLKDIAQEDTRFEMDIEIADLHNAIPIVSGAKDQHYDVIISRGGTASIIREHVLTPVVEIPVSGYDILRVLTLVKDFNSQVAIIGYPNICRGMASVSSLLDFKIPIYCIDQKTDVQFALQDAFNNGVKIVLGDVVTVRTAEEMGYNGILITSGRESVLEALSEVKRIYEVVKKANENERFYKLILENHRTGVIATDSKGVILYANHAAALLLGYDNRIMQGMNLTGMDQAWGRYLEEAAKSDVFPIIKQIKYANSRLMNIEINRPTEVKDPSYLIYMNHLENNVKQYAYSAFEVTERIATFAQIIGSSSAIQQAIKRAKVFAQTDKPIWISGEAGSGKNLFTQAIHSASQNKLNGLYVLPCDILTETEQESILFGSASEPGLMQLEAVGTVCLKQIQYVSLRVQQKLLEAIRVGTHVRIIVCSLLLEKNLIKKEQLNKEFAQLFVETHLQLPPLRDRIEDIEDIARVLIASYNSRYGKQIVGIRQDVMEDLMQREWQNNINQMKAAIEAMLIFTNGHYIGDKEANEGWRRVNSLSQTETIASQSVLLSLSGNWEDIEQRVLWKVLQEEGMNQTKTATRLGINRSTLWRKLKNMLQI